MLCSNFIHVQTPNEFREDKWLMCQIISFNVSKSSNVGTLVLKGIVNNQNVSTSVVINDVKALLSTEIVKSLKGYYRLKIKNEQTLTFLKELYDNA